MTQKSFSEDDLLEGAFHALAHAGTLINDAVLLFRARRFSNALVLAVFAREEIGRHRIFLEESTSLPTGGAIDLAVLRAKTDDHVEKLRHSETVTMVTLPKDLADQLTEVSRRQTQPETKEVLTKIRRHARRQHKRKPHAIHERRIRALYVEPLEKGGWSVPSAVTEDEARDLIAAVISDYRSSVVVFRDSAQFSAAIDRFDLWGALEDPMNLVAAISKPDT